MMLKHLHLGYHRSANVEGINHVNMVSYLNFVHLISDFILLLFEYTSYTILMF